MTYKTKYSIGDIVGVMNPCKGIIIKREIIGVGLKHTRDDERPSIIYAFKKDGKYDEGQLFWVNENIIEG